MSGLRRIILVTLGLAVIGASGSDVAAEESVLLGACTYTISVPSESTIWNTGSSVTIQWFKTGTCSQKIDLDLWREDQRVATIVNNEQNNGIYNWGLPSYLRTALEYQVRIRDRDDQYSQAFSAKFTILNPSYCGYRITAPSTGDTWERGAVETIRWNRAGTCTSPVDLHLLRNGDQIAEIANRTSDVGSFNWPVPDPLVDGGGYSIRIRDSNDRNSYDVSDVFSIGDHVQPCSYQVTSPTSDSVWHMEEDREVTWATEGSCGDRVDLDLLLAGEQVAEITDGLLDGGSFLWTIPTGLVVSSDYAVRVRSDDDGSVFDVSAAFTIEEPVPTDRVYVFDAAANLPGQAGSHWRTDLVLKNLAGVSANVVIRLFGSGGGSIPSTVAPESQRAWVDVLDLMAVEGKGWLQITSDQPVLVSGRTYNQGGGGTYGQFVAGVEGGAVLRAGDAGYLIQLRQNEGVFRSNLLLTNTSAGTAAVRVTLYDSAGTDLINYRVDLAPHGQFQDLEPFKERAERPNIDWGFAGVEVLEGTAVLATASVIDSRTNDATTIPLSTVSQP